MISGQCKYCDECAWHGCLCVCNIGTPLYEQDTAMLLRNTFMPLPQDQMSLTYLGHLLYTLCALGTPHRQCSQVCMSHVMSISREDFLGSYLPMHLRPSTFHTSLLVLITAALFGTPVAPLTPPAYNGFTIMQFVSSTNSLNLLQHQRFYLPSIRHPSLTDDNKTYSP